jgi:hypothetical protein
VCHVQRKLDATPYDVKHFSYFRSCVEEQENPDVPLQPERENGTRDIWGWFQIIQNSWFWPYRLTMCIEHPFLELPVKRVGR